MSFRHPFQKICYIRRRDGTSKNLAVLITASGSSIFSLDIESGEPFGRWPLQDHDQDGELDGTEDAPSTGNEDHEPPTKRRKLSSENHELDARRSSDESIEIIAQREKGQRRKQKVVDTRPPNVSHIVTTSDGRYVVALTAENKAVNVIETETRRLKTLSQRCMPKRLCALSLSPDERTILVGDKFGDVYCLPLLVQESSVPAEYAAVKPEKPEAFTPSASELTVHSKSNLEALRQQRAQHMVKSKKETPNFEHKLLLGHVSLLTDLAITNLTTDAGAVRQYILTSDRDEHIRVSRGLTQAYIIEGYCLGHKEFISKICILPFRPELVVVGSGEPSLKLYYWPSGRLIQDAFHLPHVREDIAQAASRCEGTSMPSHLAVSGIWPIDLPTQGLGMIIVAIEGLPLLLSFTLRDDVLMHHDTILTPSNVLDATVLPSPSPPLHIVLTFDTLHVPCRMQTYRATEADSTSPPDHFAAFTLDQIPTSEEGTPPEEKWYPSSLTDALNRTAQSLDLPLVDPETDDEKSKRGRKDRKNYSKLGEVLYGLENLRKKRGGEVGGAEDEEGVEGEE